jgi:hypothetical protein
LPSIKWKKKNPVKQAFYINDIFEREPNSNRYTHRALLYQDILRYCTLNESALDDKYQTRLKGTPLNTAQKLIMIQKEPDSFRIRELGTWLMRNNEYFRDFYSDSKGRTPIGARIANNDRLIKDCINDLENAGLFVKVDVVKSAKNELYTPIYSPTIDRDILLLVMQYNNRNSQSKSIAQHIIFYLIQRYFSPYKSYIVDFISNLYTKILKKGFATSIINLFIQVLHKDNYKLRNLADLLNIVLHMHLMHHNTREKFSEIYMETIDELDEEVKKIVLYHEKAEIESRIHLYQPPKEWEKLWIRNTHELTKIVLYGVCQNQDCLQQYPVVVDYYLYRKEILSEGYLKRTCEKCNTKNSLHVYNSLENKQIQTKL